MFSQKKKYFKKKLQAVQGQLWDWEFKKEKTIMVRESIRQEYDGAQARLASIDSQIKSLPENKTKWTDEQKRLEDQRILLVRDIEGEVDGQGTKTRNGYKDTLMALDFEVNGSPKTNQFPEGLNGINQQLDALRELKEMLIQFIKTL